MTHPSPFYLARQEHETHPSYFLPTSFTRIEAPKPLYVVGSRGTGKTTFLRALTSHERLSNVSLQRQLQQRDGDLFAGHYVGVYMKLPKSQLYLFDRWLLDEVQLYSDFVGLHLGLHWVELIADSLSAMITCEMIDVGPNDELAAISAILDRYDGYPAVVQYLIDTQTTTLPALAKGVRELRREFERTAQRGRSIDDAVERFPIERLASFAQFAASQLVRLLPDDRANPWSFRICMDEGESMSHRQQLVMNSLVRTIEWPLVPVVAYVSLSAWPNETDSPLTVGRADVDDIPLDRMTDEEFTEFVEGVAAVRLQDAVDDPNISVDLERSLGRLDLNALLYDIIGQSATSEGRELLARAEANLESEFFAERNSEAPPIYQTHLVERLAITVPSQDDSQRVRAQKSAEIRKRNVAAYLDICRGLANTTPRYASAAMVIQMSDGCVRDFLWQLHELFTESALPASDFAASTMPSRPQSRALTRASEQKIGRIGSTVLAEPRQAERMVDGLAQLTAELQRPRGALARDVRHLRSPEPGWWCLPDLPDGPVDPMRSDPETLPSAYRLVMDAVESGYLRISSSPERPWRFRVHTSLAAHYGFSYRGAQYDVSITPQQIRQLCEPRPEGERRALLRTFYESLRGGLGAYPTLFEADDQ